MGGRRGYSIPIDLDAVLERYARGESLVAIAKALGIHYNTLCMRTKRAGIVFANNPTGKEPTVRHAVCRRGHDLTLPLARDIHGCVECRRTRDREAHRAARHKPKSHKRKRNRKAEASETPPEQRDLTRAILDLHDAWERETRAWLKQELAQQIARMRA